MRFQNDVILPTSCFCSLAIAHKEFEDLSCNFSWFLKITAGLWHYFKLLWRLQPRCNILVCLLLLCLLPFGLLPFRLLLFCLLNIFTSICFYNVFAALLLNFDLPRFCMPLLKFCGYSFMEHPDIIWCKMKVFSWKHFFMGRGMFHSTLNCT